MNKQQKEVQQAHLNNEKAVLEALKQNYEDALLEINSNLHYLMNREDADMQHVIYQAEYQKALKDQIEGILNQLNSNEFETVSEYLTHCYEEGFVGTMYDLQSQGIPLIFPIDQEKVVQAIQHDTKLSSSLYASFDMKDLKKKISGEISRGISNAVTYNEIARNISGHAIVNLNNAMRIARTEGHRINIKSAMDAQQKAREKGADIVKQWDASLDGKTRPHHRELDGQIRELDEDFEYSGGLVFAPAHFGIASEDINCRCVLLQRARWALGNDITKYSPDAVEEISDDGVTKLEKIKAKDYDEFKKKYMSEAERVRRNAQKMKGSDGDMSDSSLLNRFIQTSAPNNPEKDFVQGLQYVKNKDARTLLEYLYSNADIQSSSSLKSKNSNGKITLGKKADACTVAHELFHNLFYKIKDTDSEFMKKELFSDYANMYVKARMENKTIVDYLASNYAEIFEDVDYKHVHEKYRGFSDILYGLTDGAIDLGYAHREDGYWLINSRLQSEGTAQYGRIYFQSDENVIKFMKEMLPESTKAMELKMKEMADVLRKTNR